jgi:hypothetical protein
LLYLKQEQKLLSYSEILVNIQVRHPKVQAPNTNKKKAGRLLIAPKKKEKRKETKDGIVTGYYFNFVVGCMDIMDRHSEFKNHYIR